MTATDAATYQWYYRASASAAWRKVDNADAATLSFAAKAAQNGREFRCLVKNNEGSVYTNTVTLTVK